MDKKLIEELKEKLEAEKNAAEEQLKTFADKDADLKGDWDSKFPKFNGEFGGAAMETAADEVGEYDSRIEIEHNLEIKLRDANIALEKIAKSEYGKCEKCTKDIDEDRLKIHPAARLCMKCS